MRVLTLFLLCALLIAACTPQATATPEPTLTPTLVPTLQDSITPEPTIDTSQPFVITATNDPNNPTETLIPATIEQLVGEVIEPPITIELPDGWVRVSADAMLVPDMDSTLAPIPFAFYKGPVTGGTGNVILFWGYSNLSINPNPFVGSTMDQVMFGEGLRLFRAAVVEQGCNPGTDLQKNFNVGERVASGTNFVIVDCPQSPDARGWFAALYEKDLNFVFFNFVEPDADIDSPEAIQAMGIAEQEIQAIVNTVRFTVPDVITATPSPTP